METQVETKTYQNRRTELETYFDRTAMDAWKKLTSNAKVSGIRATVRAGRDRMRATLVSWLPEDMNGKRLLDAGCGTGALSLEAAKKGANVIAIDLSPNLIALADERTPQSAARARIDFHAGDMLDEAHGPVDYVVAMDSLIHYETGDLMAALRRLAARTDKAIIFTFAPANKALWAMYYMGKLFPRSDRSPAIVPTAEAKLRKLIAADPALKDWSFEATERVKSGFYISQAVKLVKKRGAA